LDARLENSLVYALVKCGNFVLLPASGKVTKLRRLFHEEKQIIDFGLDCPDVGQRTGAGKLRFFFERHARKMYGFNW
jgi:hypothetical protein